jgi:hypothetical protein
VVKLIPVRPLFFISLIFVIQKIGVTVFMRGILIFILLSFSYALSAQDIQFPPDTIVESDGQYFMPYSAGLKEKTVKVAPDVARMKPSQVSILKRKLKTCIDLFSNDSVFNPFSGLKVIFREEIYSLNGINETAKWIPSSVEIGLYTTLAKDSMPYWESTPDAWITIHFNNPEKLVGNPVINNIYMEPVQTDSWQPWIEFDRISVPNRVTVVKKYDLPWFEPVTREDFILTLITFFQGSIEKAEKKAGASGGYLPSNLNPSSREAERQKFAVELDRIRKFDPALAEKLMQAYLEAEESGTPDIQNQKSNSLVDRNIMLNTWREAVRKLKAEMNAMSPVELKSQAWWSDTENSNVSGLTPSGFSGSRPLVRLNKNLIDKTRPGSSIQLIVAEWSMLPGLDFTDITGYNLAYDKISQLGKNLRLWKQVFELIDP